MEYVPYSFATVGLTTEMLVGTQTRESPGRLTSPAYMARIAVDPIAAGELDDIDIASGAWRATILSTSRAAIARCQSFPRPRMVCTSVAVLTVAGAHAPSAISPSAIASCIRVFLIPHLLVGLGF